MARKPDKVVPLKIRIREDLHRRIEQAAKTRGVSANFEAASRIEYSFDQEAHQSIFGIVEDMKGVWARYSNEIRQLAMQGDLIHATEALISQIKKDGNKAAIGTAVAKVEQAIRAIELSTAGLAFRMHTAGAGQ